MVEFEYVKDIVIKNKIAIFSILISIVSVLGSAFYVYANKCPEVCMETTKTEALTENKQENIGEEQKLIKVDVKGAVKKPGVYEMDQNTCVMDALTKAGGLNTKGTTSNINLSRKLKDEMVVYIFTKDELKRRESKNEIVCEVPKCECETIDTSVCLPEVNSSKDATNSSKDVVDSSKNDIPKEEQKVSLNRGTLNDFMTLEGIGQSKAEAILAYREQNGNFEKIEDIMNVSGIGEKAFEKIKDRLIL